MNNGNTDLDRNRRFSCFVFIFLLSCPASCGREGKTAGGDGDHRQPENRNTKTAAMVQNGNKQFDGFVFMCMHVPLCHPIIECS